MLPLPIFQKLLTSELDGCVSWSVSLETLISTLDLIVTRDLRLMVATDANDPVIQPVRPDEPHPRLTEREARILDGLVKGHANRMIARTCDIAEETVKVHIKSILRKIRVENRTQAALWAMANGYAS